MSLIAILGKTPNVSIAELESLYGPGGILDHSKLHVELDLLPQNFDINRVGGIQKIGVFIDKLETNDWRNVQDYLAKNIIKICEVKEGSKAKIGISTYGSSTSTGQINASGLTLKKSLKSAGYSCRVIPSKGPELNTAQVLYGGLLRSSGAEILVIQAGRNTIIAKTIQVQDIDAYAARDHARPNRDTFVGMLPPKLAQIIINLSSSHSTKTILDPFCGTGVVLQEALMMGYRAQGSDLEPRMVEYSEKNIAWLHENIKSEFNIPFIETGDATSHLWFSDDKLDDRTTSIACETFLGRPLSIVPKNDELNKIIQDCNTIHKKFLKNVARQTMPGFKLCIAVPCWRINGSLKHMDLLDSIEELGYNYVSFSHVNTKSLIYSREDQIVARELVVLIRK